MDDEHLQDVQAPINLIHLPTEILLEILQNILPSYTENNMGTSFVTKHKTTSRCRGVNSSSSAVLSVSGRLRDIGYDILYNTNSFKFTFSAKYKRVWPRPFDIGLPSPCWKRVRISSFEAFPRDAALFLRNVSITIEGNVYDYYQDLNLCVNNLSNALVGSKSLQKLHISVHESQVLRGATDAGTVTPSRHDQDQIKYILAPLARFYDLQEAKITGQVDENFKKELETIMMSKRSKVVRSRFNLSVPLLSSIPRSRISLQGMLSDERASD